MAHAATNPNQQAARARKAETGGYDYIKSNKLQTRTENGEPENAGKFIVADAKLLTVFKNTNTTSKSGKVTDLRNLNEGETINMMQLASVVGANIE